MPSTTANRLALVAALRNLPPDFDWDFSRHNHCALKLVEDLGILPPGQAYSGNTMRAIGLPGHCWDIFITPAAYGLDIDAYPTITATLVADKIEEIAAAEAAKETSQPEPAAR